MKTIKKILVLFLLPALTAFAGPGPMIKKQQAKGVIRKTAVVIMHAYRRVKTEHVYTGNLARAIAHQKFAIRLYREGKYFKAIHHSRMARRLAILALKANKGEEMADWKYSKEEEANMKSGPTEEELSSELSKEMPGAAVKDEDVISDIPDVDLKNDE